MSTLTMAEVICMALLCCLLGPTLGLSSLQDLNSGRTRRGLFGTGGGLLGGLLGGGDTGGGGGLLSGVLGGGVKGGGGGLLGGVLGGGDTGGGGGLLGDVLGGDGGKGGLLGGVGGLLNNATNGVLGGGDTGGGGGLLGGVLGGDGGKGGLLGGVGDLLNNATNGVLGGGDTGGGGGLLGGVLGGGDTGGGGGLLGGVLGGKGGLLGGVGGLLNNATNGVLPGVGGLLNGVLNQTQLVDLLTGRNGLLGLTDVLGLLGLGYEGPQEPFQWHDILNLQFIRGSWKIVNGTELILNLQSKIIMKLPGMLFRTVTVDVDIIADLAITQDKPGDLKLVLKNCKNLVAGFSVKLPPGLLALLVSNVINSAIRNTLPSVFCPIFHVGINFVNQQLQTLNNYVFFGLLGKIHTALSTVPMSSGHFSELDFKDKPFPGFFLKWLLSHAKLNPGIA